ncbi:hypothetical protein F4680DRAFT_445788 [Xylaria scruposa]|nr:hypothetical protein F4680DRAFT_445788 [Xylaria scruposa]
MESTPNETALSIILSSRSYGTPIRSIPTPKAETKGFRELFCASLEPQPTPPPSQTTTSSNTQGNSTKHADTRTERSTEPVLPVAPEDPVRNLPENSKTMKPARWTDRSTNVNNRYRGLGQINYVHLATNKRLRKRFERVQQDIDEYYRKEEEEHQLLQDLREGNFEMEPQPEPRRLNFDWDEFNREVEENNLKTLKDSRWA